MEIRRHCRIKKEIEDADLKLVGIESVNIRPDHGRMIWDEKAMPGYGLYDRALGAAYLNGLWAAIEKQRQR